MGEDHHRREIRSLANRQRDTDVAVMCLEAYLSSLHFLFYFFTQISVASVSYSLGAERAAKKNGT